MAKAYGPLLSLHASGTVGKAITFSDRGDYATIKSYRKQNYNLTPARIHHNGTIALSNLLCALIRARPTHMNTGPDNDLVALSKASPGTRPWAQKVHSHLARDAGENIRLYFQGFDNLLNAQKQQWQALSNRLWPGLQVSKWVYMGDYWQFWEWVVLEPEEYAYFWVHTLASHHLLTTTNPQQL